MLKLSLIVGVAIVVAALTSLCEAVLYSVPLSHVEVLAKSGTMSGRILKKLKKDIQRPITAILTLNTIANIMGAAMVGAAAVAVFSDQYLSWFSAVFTLAVLLFAEIVPKTAGVTYAKTLAPWIALPLDWLVKVLSPMVWLCEVTTRLTSSRKDPFLVSAEEIQAIAAMSLRSGGIEPEQEKVISNILELKNKYVRKVMTPRTVTFSLSEHLTLAEAKQRAAEWDRHSRVPVYDKDSDDVVGIVLRKDVFKTSVDEDDRIKLSDLVRPVHFIPESARLDRVMLEFLERRQHLFVTVDEYGTVTGVISLEDILEEIVGREIVDESDQATNMRELARIKRKGLTSN